MNTQQPLPFAQALIKGNPDRRVDVREYSSIFVAAGITSVRKTEWERQYGMDSLGIGFDGGLIAPGFPVLSKIGWMYIDPVDLSLGETEALVDECARAIANTNDFAARTELKKIQELAQEAIAHLDVVRFGPP